MHVSVGAEESTLYWRSSVFVLSVFVYTKQSQLPLLKCSGVAGQASTCCHATVNGNFGIWREGRNSNASVFLLESKLQGFLGFSKFLKAQVKNIFIFLRDRNAPNPALSHKKKITHVWLFMLPLQSCMPRRVKQLHKCGFYSLFPPSSCSSHLSFFTLT